MLPISASGAVCADDARDRGAVAEKIAALAGDDRQFVAVFHDRHIIGEHQPVERGMRRLDAGIEDRDAHAAPAPAPDRRRGFRGSDPRFHARSSRPSARREELVLDAAARAPRRMSCRASRCSGSKPGGAGSVGVGRLEPHGGDDAAQFAGKIKRHGEHRAGADAERAIERLVLPLVPLDVVFADRLLGGDDHADHARRAGSGDSGRRSWRRTARC